MRRSIINEYDKLADKLANYVGAMKYRFMNLCVKSEPVALITVKIMIEGELKKIEDCCKVSKDDDYHFKLFPKYDEDMPAVRMGVARVHPEFKQEEKSIKMQVPDGTGKVVDYDVKYLELTMPEVDDDRYDVLKEGVKAVYDDCKFQMEFANSRSKTKFAELAPTETKENLDTLDAELDKLNKQWDEQRDRLYEQKMNEVNAAYEKWLVSKGKDEIAQMELEDAEGNDVTTRMKLSHKGQ